MKPSDTEADPGEHFAGGLAHRYYTDGQEWATLRAGIPPDQENQDILCEGTLSTGGQVMG